MIEIRRPLESAGCGLAAGTSSRIPEKNAVFISRQANGSRKRKNPIRPSALKHSLRNQSWLPAAMGFGAPSVSIKY